VHLAVKLSTVIILVVATASNLVAIAQTTPTQPQSDPATREKNLQEARAKYNSVLSTEHINISEKIPINFPVPSYNSNVTSTSFVNSIKGAPTATAGIVTKDSPENVFKWYQDKLRNGGWSFRAAAPKLMDKIGKAGTLFMLEAKKEQQGVKVACLLDPRTRGTNVSVIWVKNRLGN